MMDPLDIQRIGDILFPRHESWPREGSAMDALRLAAEACAQAASEVGFKELGKIDRGTAIQERFLERLGSGADAWRDALASRLVEQGPEVAVWVMENSMQADGFVQSAAKQSEQLSWALGGAPELSTSDSEQWERARGYAVASAAWAQTMKAGPFHADATPSNRILWQDLGRSLMQDAPNKRLFRMEASMSADLSGQVASLRSHAYWVAGIDPGAREISELDRVSKLIESAVAPFGEFDRDEHAFAMSKAVKMATLKACAPAGDLSARSGFELAIKDLEGSSPKGAAASQRLRSWSAAVASWGLAGGDESMIQAAEGVALERMQDWERLLSPNGLGGGDPASEALLQMESDRLLKLAARSHALSKTALSGEDPQSIFWSLSDERSNPFSSLVDSSDPDKKQRLDEAMLSMRRKVYWVYSFHADQPCPLDARTQGEKIAAALHLPGENWGGSPESEKARMAMGVLARKFQALDGPSQPDAASFSQWAEHVAAHAVGDRSIEGVKWSDALGQRSSMVGRECAAWVQAGGSGAQIEKKRIEALAKFKPYCEEGVGTVLASALAVGAEQGQDAMLEMGALASAWASTVGLANKRKPSSYAWHLRQSPGLAWQKPEVARWQSLVFEDDKLIREARQSNESNLDIDLGAMQANPARAKCADDGETALDAYWKNEGQPQSLKERLKAPFLAIDRGMDALAKSMIGAWGKVFGPDPIHRDSPTAKAQAKEAAEGLRERFGFHSVMFEGSVDAVRQLESLRRLGGEMALACERLGIEDAELGRRGKAVLSVSSSKMRWRSAGGCCSVDTGNIDVNEWSPASTLVHEWAHSVDGMVGKVMGAPKHMTGSEWSNQRAGSHPAQEAARQMQAALRGDAPPDAELDAALTAQAASMAARQVAARCLGREAWAAMSSDDRSQWVDRLSAPALGIACAQAMAIGRNANRRDLGSDGFEADALGESEALFKNIMSGEPGAGGYSGQHARAIAQALEEIGSMPKDEALLAAAGCLRSDGLQLGLSLLGVGQPKLDADGAGVVEARRSTFYDAECSKRDQEIGKKKPEDFPADYFRSPHEMLARAVDYFSGAGVEYGMGWRELAAAPDKARSQSFKTAWDRYVELAGIKQRPGGMVLSSSVARAPGSIGSAIAAMGRPVAQFIAMRSDAARKLKQRRAASAMALPGQAPQAAKLK